ncbi:MAG TPA: segregation/condensation protein A, partial [bacterium]|nr:segregation/condensation protein A [bacterium]
QWEGEGSAVTYDLSNLTLNKLLTAFQRALTRERPPTITVVAPKLSVADVIREIRHLRRTGQLAFSFGTLVEVEPVPYRVVAVFLALLELARQGKLRLVQTEFNGDIAAEWEEAPAGA